LSLFTLLLEELVAVVAAVDVVPVAVQRWQLVVAVEQRLFVGGGATFLGLWKPWDHCMRPCLQQVFPCGCFDDPAPNEYEQMQAAASQHASGCCQRQYPEDEYGRLVTKDPETASEYVNAAAAQASYSAQYGYHGAKQSYYGTNEAYPTPNQAYQQKVAAQQQQQAAIAAQQQAQHQQQQQQQQAPPATA
jgi:hypothetical protein